MVENLWSIKNKHAMGICMDLSKAFDTLNQVLGQLPPGKITPGQLQAGQLPPRIINPQKIITWNPRGQLPPQKRMFYFY